MIAWGADIGYRRVSLAAVDGEASTFAVASQSVPGPDQLDEAHTMHALQLHTAMAATRLLEDEGMAPDLIYVERPMTVKKRSNEKMHYSYALVCAQLVTLGVPVIGIQVNSWKLRALGEGFGRANDGTVLAWAHRFGYGGVSQDEADAIGVAVAALQQLRAEAEPDHEQMTLG